MDKQSNAGDDEMSEVQRYMVSYATGVGESAMPSETGNWVKFTDHADRVRELEEAVRVLANLYVYGSKVDNARNAMEESGEHQHDVRKKAWIVALDEYDEAIALAMDNPIAANAVKEAGR
jgi:accessory colonization factor AcfC